MKSQVDFVYDFENDPVDELKHWLFLENVRIKEEKQEIEEERLQIENEKNEFDKYKKDQLSIVAAKEEKLEKQKSLFDKQWKLLEDELKKLAKDEDRLKKEREYLELEKRNFRKALNRGTSKEEDKRTTAQKAEESGMTVVSSFFVGTNGLSSVKKRYRELTKIFHPDNMSGDTDVLLQINKEYERIKSRYTD